MDLEHGSQPSHQSEIEETNRETNQPSNWVLAGYKVLLLVTYILALGKQYGAFKKTCPNCRQDCKIHVCLSQPGYPSDLIFEVGYTILYLRCLLIDLTTFIASKMFNSF